MNKKYLIISHNQHQLEKGLFIKNIYPEKIDVLISSISVNLGVNEKAINYKYKKMAEIPDIVDDYQKFIFFSMQPSLDLIALLKRIRLQKKEIIVIQEAHQLSTHNNNICNILISPDEVWAASDLEKNLMVSEKIFQLEIIRSPGWIFQKAYKEFLSSVPRTVGAHEYILIIFSAPRNITASSHETYSTRNNILEFINTKYSDQKILIKLHPQENKIFYMNYISTRGLNIKNIEFADDNSNIINLAEHASTVITSDSTQAFFDLIDGNSNLLIYQAGKINFISQFLKKTYASNEVHGTFYYLIDKKDKRKNSFIAEHLKPQALNDVSLKHSLDYSIQNKSYDFLLELRLWEYIYKNKSNLNAWLENFNSAPSNKIKMIDFSNKILSLELIEEISINLPLKSAMTLIYIRENIKLNNELILQEEKFIQNYITEIFVINFSLDALRLKYFYAKRSINPLFELRVEELLVNIEKNLIQKFKIFFIIATVRSYLSKKKLFMAENAILSILIFLIKYIIKIKE
jgi:hypothetical protein